MQKVVLQINNFSFSYNGVEILKDINFSADEGDYITIIGPNGAGKSTLLKCLTKIVKGGRGDIQLFGKNINNYAQKELGKIIGYVPQATEQTFPFTVYEFISMGRYPYLKPFSQATQDDVDVVDEVIELTDLSSFTDREVYTLSGGERQKVYIAACLAQQPKILLLDEPKNHLDPKHCQDVQRTISDISSKLNITTIHVTHELYHITHWSDRVIAIKNGEIVSEGNPDKVVTTSNLQTIFDTDFDTFQNLKSNDHIIIPTA